MIPPYWWEFNQVIGEWEIILEVEEGKLWLSVLDPETLETMAGDSIYLQSYTVKDIESQRYKMVELPDGKRFNVQCVWKLAKRREPEPPPGVSGRSLVARIRSGAYVERLLAVIGFRLLRRADKDQDYAICVLMTDEILHDYGVVPDSREGKAVLETVLENLSRGFPSKDASVIRCWKCRERFEARWSLGDALAFLEKRDYDHAGCKGFPPPEHPRATAKD